MIILPAHCTYTQDETAERVLIKCFKLHYNNNTMDSVRKLLYMSRHSHLLKYILLQQPRTGRNLQVKPLYLLSKQMGLVSPMTNIFEVTHWYSFLPCYQRLLLFFLLMLCHAIHLSLGPEATRVLSFKLHIFAAVELYMKFARHDVPLLTV